MLCEFQRREEHSGHIFIDVVIRQLQSLLLMRFNVPSGRAPQKFIVRGTAGTRHSLADRLKDFRVT